MADYYVQAVANPALPRAPLTTADLDLLRAFGWEVHETKGETPFVELTCISGWREEADVETLRDEGVDIDAVLATAPELCTEKCNGWLGVWGVLQHAVRKTGIPFLSVEIAFTCSKARLDGFGGAAYFITADRVESQSTQDWLAAREKELTPGNG